MRSFSLKGGIFYSIFKNPHYSYRELVYQKMIPGKSDPEQMVSGEQLLQIVNRVLYLSEHEDGVQDAGRKALDAEKQQAMEAARRQERRQMAEEINLQLAERHVEDTRADAVDEGVTISLSNIRFRADSAVLEDSERNKIYEIAGILMSIPGRKILVTGHTALAGTEGGQQRTSEERAQAVADYLVSLGVRRKEEIVVQGYGASRPVADNASAEGQALNRRVEITILE
jgi:outer membrane protein OmpA-like peptidoglycan-associated protein